LLQVMARYWRAMARFAARLLIKRDAMRCQRVMERAMKPAHDRCLFATSQRAMPRDKRPNDQMLRDISARDYAMLRDWRYLPRC
jgi:hypothetical protein